MLLFLNQFFFSFPLCFFSLDIIILVSYLLMYVLEHSILALNLRITFFQYLIPVSVSPLFNLFFCKGLFASHLTLPSSSRVTVPPAGSLCPLRDAAGLPLPLERGHVHSVHPDPHSHPHPHPHCKESESSNSLVWKVHPSTCRVFLILFP